MYLSQISECIWLKLQNLFVSNFKMYLSQIAKFICLKLQNVFVSNCKIYLSQISRPWAASPPAAAPPPSASAVSSSSAAGRRAARTTPTSSSPPTLWEPMRTPVPTRSAPPEWSPSWKLSLAVLYLHHPQVKHFTQSHTYQQIHENIFQVMPQPQL